ncbi:pyruvate synthase subunit beta [Candidatus Bathyarchaeota archaeon]|nr:MAG: pyruvate synthase subunit beta [Candidatus Bathyarchaeota archaeon]
MVETSFYFKGIKELPREELFVQGHRACSGCGEAISVRILMKAIGPNCIVINPTGCLEVVSSPYPYTSWAVPWYHVAFENGGAVASGVEAALKALIRKGRLENKKIHVVVIAGDGGTADIGFQSLSGALERGHDLLYVCLDNEAYMNTGIQRSSSTPYGAWTTTSAVGKVSFGKPQWKKNMPAIVASHGIPYVATANPAYPLDLANKAKKAVEIEGSAYLHILTPCVPGWRIQSNLSMKVARLAVQTGIFPLYEIEDGEFRLTVEVAERKHVREYLKLQSRFAHLTEEEIEKIQKRVDKESEEIGLGPRVES